MARKLSPQMTAALKLAFQAEVGRSGIAAAWMISTNTSAALVGRDYFSPTKGIHLETGGWVPRQQITAAGCEAIGRSMDEIVEWAWTDAVSAATAGKLPADLNIMSTLPVEVGAVIGWTHKGEAITGRVTGFHDNGTVYARDDRGFAWSLDRDEIERVIKLPKAKAPRRSLAFSYPAAQGDVVTQAHADHCAQYGHAQHTSDGIDTGLCPRCGDPTTPMCDHGSPVVGETPSAFKDAAPVRDYADGCQSFGPYPERAPMKLTEAPDSNHNARIEAAADGGWNAYAEEPYGYVGHFDDEQEARDAAGLGPKFPKGTPEYEAYAAELHTELEKFRKGEPPYGPIDKTAILAKPIDSLLNSGATDEVPSIGQIPDATMRQMINELGAYVHGDGEAILVEIERRLNLAAALMPAEARQILDGHTP